MSCASCLRAVCVLLGEGWLFLVFFGCDTVIITFKFYTWYQVLAFHCLHMSLNCFLCILLLWYSFSLITYWLLLLLFMVSCIGSYVYLCCNICCAYFEFILFSVIVFMCSLCLTWSFLLQFFTCWLVCITVLMWICIAYWFIFLHQWSVVLVLCILFSH